MCTYVRICLREREREKERERDGGAELKRYRPHTALYCMKSLSQDGYSV